MNLDGLPWPMFHRCCPKWPILQHNVSFVSCDGDGDDQHSQMAMVGSFLFFIRCVKCTNSDVDKQKRTIYIRRIIHTLWSMHECCKKGSSEYLWCWWMLMCNKVKANSKKASKTYINEIKCWRNSNKYHGSVQPNECD